MGQVPRSMRLSKDKGKGTTLPNREGVKGNSLGRREPEKGLTCLGDVPLQPRGKSLDQRAAKGSSCWAVLWVWKASMLQVAKICSFGLCCKQLDVWNFEFSASGLLNQCFVVRNEPHRPRCSGCFCLMHVTRPDPLCLLLEDTTNLWIILIKISDLAMVTPLDLSYHYLQI